jgi:hypothetical protein
LFGSPETPSAKVRVQYKFARDSSALPNLQCANGEKTRATRRGRGFDLLGLQQLSEMPRHARGLTAFFDGHKKKFGVDQIF